MKQRMPEFTAEAALSASTGRMAFRGQPAHRAGSGGVAPALRAPAPCYPECETTEQTICDDNGNCTTVTYDQCYKVCPGGPGYGSSSRTPMASGRRLRIEM